MCAIFGSTLKQRQAGLLGPNQPELAGLSPLNAQVRGFESLETVSQSIPPKRWEADRTLPAVRGMQEFARLLPGGIELPRPIVRENLAAAREVLAVRPLVRAEEMSAGEVVAWLQRIADFRRVSYLRLELVGVFPRLPLTEGATLKLDAVRQVARFSLEERAVSVTTVVVARRRDTGESVVARFIVS